VVEGLHRRYLREVVKKHATRNAWLVNRVSADDKGRQFFEAAFLSSAALVPQPSTTWTPFKGLITCAN